MSLLKVEVEDDDDESMPNVMQDEVDCFEGSIVPGEYCIIRLVANFCSWFVAVSSPCIESMLAYTRLLT